MKQKNIIIGILCIAICIMTIGYSAFSTRLNISGTSTIVSNWSVVFTKIEEVSKTSGVTINNIPEANGTTATFDVSLNNPGDYIEYQITVENKGTLDAIIENIEKEETENSALTFEVSGIKKGDKLAKNTLTTFKIKISYKDVSSQPEEISKQLTINISYVQDVGQVIEPDIEPTLVNAILNDNTPQSDVNIDFTKSSAEDGTKGLYYTNTNTEDNKTTYYFRGAVENNYVSFGGFYWRIVRINEDSSVRLIYQGTTPNPTGSAATIGNSAFNANMEGNATIGYMYGDPYSSTYAETHANERDSTIKQFIDSWYEDNLIAYSTYLADAGFCGDRSIESGDGIGANETRYGTGHDPQFSCPQSNDLYTTSSSNKGNKALDYPIGLLTVDEVKYAGGSKSNSNYYLYINGIGRGTWTMTPATFDSAYPFIFSIYSSGGFTSESSDWNISVRPVINLKSTTEIIEGGNGTQSNPYVIS